MMKRIFIAIKTDPGVALQRIYASLRSDLRDEKITWVSQENIHLTLAFLGDTEEERIKVAGIVLSQKCTGFGEFTVQLSGTGVFRNFNDPRVIWIGIENCEKLIFLNSLIINGLKDTGFKFESRPFNPHITLGRVKSVQNKEILKAALSGYEKMFIQEVHVKEVILFESILRPDGPVYRPVGTFALH